MSLINFFISYFLLLIASSIVITSFFCVTRGYTDVLADGSERQYGKILKGYYFFWFKKSGIRRIQYTGNQLAILVHSFKEYYNKSFFLVKQNGHASSANSFEVSSDFLEVLPILSNKFEVELVPDSSVSDKITVTAFAIEPLYFFPEWLRTVMAGCITCTPTVYGNIIYWAVVIFFKRTVLFTSLFYCFNNVYAGIILVWLSFWISLAWLNTVLWNIYDK